VTALDYAKHNATSRERLLDILSDLQWHSSTELTSTGIRYSARILELKRMGYQIEDEYVGAQDKRYRLASLTRGAPQEKRVKIYLEEAEVRDLLVGRLRPSARKAIAEAWRTFQANKDKL
jgi:hypothetical protein